MIVTIIESDASSAYALPKASNALANTPARSPVCSNNPGEIVLPATSRVIDGFAGPSCWRSRASGPDVVPPESAVAVRTPTRPSTVIPRLRWKAATARRVPEPNSSSTTTSCPESTSNCWRCATAAPRLPIWRTFPPARTAAHSGGVDAWPAAA